MRSTSILIVSDDTNTSMNLKSSLNKQGYTTVNITESAAKFRQKLRAYKPQLIMIDTSLQTRDDGIELASHVREKYKLPFVFLSSHSDSTIINKAKLTQPYGYIVKPCNPLGLNATIQIAIHKYDQERQRAKDMNALEINRLNLQKRIYDKKAAVKEVLFGDGYNLDKRSCTTFCHGEKIKLTKKENAFIQLLVSQLGSTVSFQQAIDYLWEQKGATENSVRTLVWRLRSKLPSDIIQNAQGIGYYIEK